MPSCGQSSGLRLVDKSPCTDVCKETRRRQFDTIESTFVGSTHVLLKLMQCYVVMYHRMYNITLFL
jgi:hypothetical protein